MQPHEVARSYDSIADRWFNELASWSNGIEQHRRAIAFTELRGPALDIGCGSSGRILDLLAAAGFTPEGLDISPRMVELAQRRHPGLMIHQADICDWEFPHSYDLISAWDSIWHIPLVRQERVLSRVLSHLAPRGVCIFTTGGVDAPSEIRNSEMGPPMYHSALGITATLQCLADSGCVCRHLEYDQFPESHVYLIAQRLSEQV